MRDHRIERRGGVLRLMNAEFAATLDRFTAHVSSFRDASGRRQMSASAFPGLPESQIASRDTDWAREWQGRADDLELVTGVLAGKGQKTVLDIGAWNGWLSNRLALRGHAVTAVDYFDDPHDGLGAHAFYTSRWEPVQMDLADLSLLGARFDLIVINRCLQFFPDPPAYVRHAAGLLAPAGLLIATGLQVYRDPQRKRQHVEALRQSVRDRFGFELFLRPTKGYLDDSDRRQLEAAGMRLIPYPSRLRANLLAALVPSRPRLLYGRLDAAQ